MFAGQVMLGFSVSLTVTVKLQLVVLLDESVAVQMTVLVPFAKVEPLDGMQTTPTPGQSSLAVSVKVTAVLHWPTAVLATMFAGQVIAGFSVSLMVTVKLQLVVLLDASVAVHMTVFVPFANVEPLAGVQTTPTPGQL